jgi:anthranilate phosphoribosyltransferase
VSPCDEREFARDCAGGTPEHNASVTRAILQGEAGGAPAAARELALLNAGAATYVAGRADSIAEGVQLARAALADGSARAALERYVQASIAAAPAEAPL